MKVRAPAMLVFVIAGCLASVALADTVRFKSGLEMQGRVSRTRDMVRIENEDGTFTVAVSRVESVVPEISLRAEPAPARAAEADGGSVLVQGRPEVSFLSSGTQLDVRPIVSPDRRYVFLELHLLSTQSWIANTYTFQSGRTRMRVRR